MVETLHIYLHDQWRAQAQAGQVNLFNRLAAALPDWSLVYHPDTENERRAAPGRGYGLFHMQEPETPNVLCLRKAYHFPFWRIENTNERWHFDVAKARFDPACIDGASALAFHARWRGKIFREGPVRRDGYVFVPLQGRLCDHRSFQSMSPLAMLETVLEHDPHRRVLATLHPKEAYAEREHTALAALQARFSRLELVKAEAKDLLGACDHVVTQNSGVALTGYFAGKSAVLFAGSDFHHIAGSVPRDGLATALAHVEQALPDFARYLWWFYKENAINGGAPDCEDQIRARLRRHGWPVQG